MIVLLAVFFVLLSFSAISTVVSHPAAQITSGLFPGYSYTFPANLSVNNTLYVAGKFGVGTMDPTNQLTVVKSGARAVVEATTYATTPADYGAQFLMKRARGTTSSPAIVVNGDLVGNLDFGAYDGNSFEYSGGVSVYVDGTVSDGVVPMRISFETSETESSGRAGRLVIKSDGNVGIGTTSPTQKLTVVGTVNATSFIGGGSGLTGISGDGTGGWVNDSATASTGLNVNITSGNMTVVNGNVGIGTASNGNYRLYVVGDAYFTDTWGGSDVRWKKNIRPLWDSLRKVMRLQGMNYEWNIEEYPGQGFREGLQVGLIAQDVEKVIPELVHTDDKGYKSVSYEKMTAVLVEAVKEQQAEIEQLKAIVCLDHPEADACL